MKINYTYRMYGRSKGRGKKNKITRVYVAIPSLNKFKINILTKKLNNSLTLG